MVAIITRDNLTSAKTPATGRKLFTLDGDTFEIGSTGLRDLSGIVNMTYVDSCRLLGIRTRDGVLVHGVDVILKAGAPPSVVLLTNDRTNTGSFKPAYPVTGRAVAATGNLTATTGPGADVTINPAFGITMHGATPGVAYQFSLAYTTLAGWASALPGVADGDPIGV